jgi:hypothetical protein
MALRQADYSSTRLTSFSTDLRSPHTGVGAREVGTSLDGAVTHLIETFDATVGLWDTS